MKTVRVDLERLKRLCDAASGRHWILNTWSITNGHTTEADRECAEAARTALPDLIAEVERLRGALEKVLEHTDRVNSWVEETGCIPDDGLGWIEDAKLIRKALAPDQEET